MHAGKAQQVLKVLCLPIGGIYEKNMETAFQHADSLYHRSDGSVFRHHHIGGPRERRL
jgi:hypothetical protein